MIKKSACLGILSLVLFIFGVNSVAAQEFRGNIAGTVSDPNGAVVPGATVTVVNTETNVTATATTNDSGAYNFPLLLPGKYKLTVNIEGYKTSVREQLTVNIDDRLTVDFNLEIGATTEVNIVADTELVERGSVTTGTVITERQISELPLSEGAAYNLATQAPGVSYTGNPNFTGPTANGNLAAFRTNGAPGNQITLDGSPNLTFDGGVAYTPPADAVTQFKIQTNAFDAQNGFTAGSTVNVAVKSGTNKLHGSAYYFDRSKVFTSNNFFSNRAGEERPDRKYYRYGGQVNGPVYIPYLYNGKDKTFFMFSYEKQYNKRPEPEVFTVPTLKMRTGDFSELLALPSPILIYDPATAYLGTTACARTGTTLATVCRTPFAGNIIPTARLNAAAVAYLNLFPTPNQTGLQNGTVDNFFSNQINIQPYDSYLTRIDHNFNESNRIFGKFFYSKSDEDRYNFIGTDDAVTRGLETRKNIGGNIDYTATLSSNLILDLRSSLNDFVQDRIPTNPISSSALGFAGIAALTTSSVFPRFDFTNYDTIGPERSDFNEGLTRNFRLFSIQPTITQIFGNHTFKYGYDFRRLMENRTTNNYNAGRFSFTGAYTAPASNSNAATVSAIGRDLASFLLGLPASGSIDTTPAQYDVYSNYHSFFIQDDWRVTPKLTLNLGLRYELESGLREDQGRFITGFDTTTASPLRASVLTNYNANVPAGVPINAFQNLSGGIRFAADSDSVNQSMDKNNFQPRVGISYALDNKTVLRGGFGIFTSPFQIQAIGQPGFAAQTQYASTSNNGLTFLSTLNTPFPNGVNPATGSSLGLLTLLGATLGTTNATGPTETTYYSFDRKNANYTRFVAGIQRELPYSIGAEATFIFSRGSDLPVLRQLNYLPAELLNNFQGVTDGATILNAITATQTALNTVVANPFRGLVTTDGTLNANTITRRRLLTAFPQFQDLIITEYNGSSSYRSLQLQATKRFSQGLTFNTSYTYAHDREKTRRLNPQDAELTDAISPASRPHRFTFSGTYELPFGRGREYFSSLNRFADIFLGGWQFNGVFEKQSGEPLLLQNVFFNTTNMNPEQLVNKLGQRDEQGRKYGVDIPAFDITNFRVLDTRQTINGVANAAFNTLVVPGYGNNYTIGSQNTLRSLPLTLNNFRNQPFQKFDASLTKNFRIREGMKLQVRIEAINALNWVYFSGLQLASNNANFGFANTQRNLPRDIQLGGRFTF
jgi:Carboxypeptidase regulatory-like domain